MGKIIGIQKELNELAEALTLNGFEVTNMLDTHKELDAIIYYNDEGNMLRRDEMIDSILEKNNSKALKINAAKTNIDDIMNILNKLT
ncbi:YkuS family protein [Wukongibacter sp. M2B1]|uniref:YkuS family protein n=1 Tax=Wukongibacter sp. M2B1 TaxID=3088895 RepID=UPI003D7C0DB6